MKKPSALRPSKFDMTRQQFDACVKRVAMKVPLTPAQRTMIWRVFNGLPPEPAAPPVRVAHWTPEALQLLDPLRVEIEHCQHAARRGTIERRYEGISVRMPGGGRGREPVDVDVLDLFDIYVKELVRIRTEMEAALHAGNHWIDGTSSTEPDSLAIIVANERAAHTAAHPRYAGTHEWPQWARPTLRKYITHVFEQARAVTPTKGRSWRPFTVPGRGRTAFDKKAKAWREAFDAAIVAIDPIHKDFIAELRSPSTHAAIEDWINMQCDGRYSLKPEPDDRIWRNLPRGLGMTLASQYHEALADAFAATKDPQYNPAYAHNPFARPKPDALDDLLNQD